MWTARSGPAAGAEKFEGFSHFSLKINTFPLKTSLRRLQTTFKHCKESILDIDERGGGGGGGGARQTMSRQDLPVGPTVTVRTTQPKPKGQETLNLGRWLCSVWKFRNISDHIADSAMIDM